MDIALFAANDSFARLFEATDQMVPGGPVLGVCAEAMWSSWRHGSLTLTRIGFLLSASTPESFPPSPLRMDELAEHGVLTPGNAVFSAYAALVECDHRLDPNFAWFDSAQTISTPDTRLMLAMHGAILFLDVLPQPERPRTLDVLQASSGALHRPAATAHAALQARHDARPALELGTHLLQGFLDDAWDPRRPPRPFDVSL